MIFTPAQARLILRGAKTQHRHPVKHRERKIGRTKVGTRYEYTTNPWRPQIGAIETVTVPGGGTQGAHIKITSARRETLASLTLDTPAAIIDARAEGFRTRAGFADDWMCRHDPNWPPVEEQLCPTCTGHAELGDGEPCPNPECELGTVLAPADVDDQTVLARFAERHGQTEVWVIDFHLEHDVPLLLAAKPPDPAHGQGDYTSRKADAMPDEPEAVDPSTLTPGWGQGARARHADALRTRDAALAGPRSPEERLAELRRLASERGVDIAGDEAVIGQRLDRIEERVRKAPTQPRRAA